MGTVSLPLHSCVRSRIGFHLSHRDTLLAPQFTALAFILPVIVPADADSWTRHQCRSFQLILSRYSNVPSTFMHWMEVASSSLPHAEKPFQIAWPVLCEASHKETRLPGRRPGRSPVGAWTISRAARFAATSRGTIGRESFSSSSSPWASREQPSFVGSDFAETRALSLSGRTAGCAACGGRTPSFRTGCGRRTAGCAACGGRTPSFGAE